MACKCAEFDNDNCRFICSLTGEGCMYLFPSSALCAKEYGKGPDIEENDN